MTKLNLISPEQKDKLTVKYIHLLMENLLGVFVIAVVIFAIILIPLSENSVILEYQNEYSQKSSLNKNKDITRKISFLNSQIEVYDTILSSSYAWSDLLVSLSSSVPDNISLSQFDVSVISGNFIIRGFSSTRDDLIVLIDNLSNSKFFVDVDSPFKNYLQQADISFEITGKIINNVEI